MSLHVTILSLPQTDLSRKGEGLVLLTGHFDSPVGRIIALGAGGAIRALGLAGEVPEPEVEADLARRWPRARLVAAPEAVAPAIAALLAGHGEARVALCGTPFQMRVWQALAQIPRGQMTTYSQLAHQIGAPTAVRAVASAVGANPVAWLIPCHRVIRQDGDLGGFRWGLAAKRGLLAAERARRMAEVSGM